MKHSLCQFCPQPSASSFTQGHSLTLKNLKTVRVTNHQRCQVAGSGFLALHLLPFPPSRSWGTSMGAGPSVSRIPFSWVRRGPAPEPGQRAGLPGSGPPEVRFLSPVTGVTTDLPGGRCEDSVTGTGAGDGSVAEMLSWELRTHY